jgi:hypothetical protein
MSAQRSGAAPDPEVAGVHFAELRESAHRMARSGRRGDGSQKTCCGLSGFALAWARASSIFHQLATPFSIPSGQERWFLAVQARAERRERLLRIAFERDLHRTADREEAAVEVDLHPARRPLLRQELLP